MLGLNLIHVSESTPGIQYLRIFFIHLPIIDSKILKTV